MWVARDKSGSLILAFEKPVRAWTWTDSYCTEKLEYWSLEHNPKINYSNHLKYPYHQIINLPDSSLFHELRWEDEPIEVELKVI